MVQYLLEKMPTWAQLPFIVAYGMLQPVLPAGLVAPAPWIWKSLAIFRAVGWYALIPLLVYGLIPGLEGETRAKAPAGLFCAGFKYLDTDCFFTGWR